MSTAILQTTYFGPIQWYQKLHRFDHCMIEQYDSYQKQTYRNRCLGAAFIGMPCSQPTARVPSSNTTLMISAPSSRSDTSFWLTLMRLSARSSAG